MLGVSEDPHFWPGSTSVLLQRLYLIFAATFNLIRRNRMVIMITTLYASFYVAKTVNADIL